MVGTTGRALMLVVIAVTLFGLLGGGPVYLWTRTVSAEGLNITYQPVARFGTPSGLDVTIPVPTGARRWRSPCRTPLPEASTCSP